MINKIISVYQNHKQTDNAASESVKRGGLQWKALKKALTLEAETHDPVAKAATEAALTNTEQVNLK